LYCLLLWLFLLSIKNPRDFLSECWHRFYQTFEAD
jgi:hypothetical protein